MRPAACTFLLLGVALLLACADGPKPGPAPTATGSGIAGEVVRGPLCPIAPHGQPCPDQPVAATIVLQDRDGQRELLTVRSGDDGRFRVDLAPGEYRLVPVPPQPGAPPYAEPQVVTVHPAQYTPVTIKYDTGIR